MTDCTTTSAFTGSRLVSPYEVSIFSKASELYGSGWNSLLEINDMFMSEDYLQMVEDVSKPHIKPYYAIVSRGGKELGAFYFQIVHLDGSMLSAFIPASIQKSILRTPLDCFFKSIQQPVLVLGNLLQTHDNGIRIGNRVNVDEIPYMFDKVIRKLMKETGTGLTLISNCYCEKCSWMQGFENLNYHRFETEPDMQMHKVSEWNSFEDYLSSLGSKYRVRAKKVISESAHITRRELDAEWLKVHKEVIFRLNRNVMAHVKFSLGDITPDYFHTLKSGMGDDFKVFGYFDQDKPVGFASLFRNGFKWYAHFIGLDYQYIASGKLYNRILYDNLKEAIEGKASILEYGRTATEIKSTVGAVPEKMVAFLRHRNFVMNRIFWLFLRFMKPPAYQVRHPFKSQTVYGA